MEVVLQPLSRAQAEALVRGDFSSVEPAEGWPHADTLDGVGMAVQHGFEPPWLVLLDGRVIGDCGTFGPPDEQGAVEIGYGLAEPFRGRGLGTQVVGELLRTLLARPAVRRVTAKVETANVASRRVLEKNGFAVEQADGEFVWLAYER